MDFNQDWFMRSLETLAEGAARKLLGKKPAHEEYIELQYGGDDPVFFQLCALLSRHEFCAAEDMLWEYLRPGDAECLPLAAEFYRRMGEYSEETLEANGFSRREVTEGLERAIEFISEPEE